MFICEKCGTMAVERAICCDVETIPLEGAIALQDQLFELSGNDRAHNVLARLQAGYAAAADRVTKAEEKLAKRVAERESAGAVLIDFYKLTLGGGEGKDAAEYSAKGAAQDLVQTLRETGTSMTVSDSAGRSVTIDPTGVEDDDDPDDIATID